MRKGLLFLVVLVMLSVNVLGLDSLGTFKQGYDIKLMQLCGDCSSINLTSVTYPNSTVVVQGAQMSKNGTQYNYTLHSHLVTTMGRYHVNGVGDPSGDLSVFAYYFDVTPNGTNNSMSTPIIIFAVAVLFVLSGATYYFDNELKYFFVLATTGFIGYCAFVAANMYSGPNKAVVGALWVFYYISLIGFFMMVCYILLQFTLAFYYEKTKPPNL